MLQRSIKRIRMTGPVESLCQRSPKRLQMPLGFVASQTRIARHFSTPPNDPQKDDEENKSFAEKVRDKLNELRGNYSNVFKVYEFARSKSQEYFYAIAALALGIYLYYKSTQRTLTFGELIAIMQKEAFDELEITKYLEDERIVTASCRIRTEEGWATCDGADIEVVAETLMRIKNRDLVHQHVTYKYRNTYHYYVSRYSSIFQLAFFLYLISRLSNARQAGRGGGMGMDQFVNMKPKKFSKEMKVNKKFADIAGMDEAKLEIEEFVDFLKHPEKYKEVGAKLPRGALLSGPPGTGKTLLAKACAGEAGVPFFFVSGSEFVEMFVGVGASRVRELFKEAKSSSPAIIFVDEIDAIGKKRSERLSGNAESDATLNQLLVEMDGFGTDANVVVFAATNRKELLDPALTRPGRFDRAIEINLPDIDGRYQIFKIHLKPLRVADEADKERFAKRLASLTPGFSGADIANICNEAAIQAVRSKKEIVEDIDFELAVERVIGGLETKRPLQREERRTVAVHECGHGVVSWFLEGAAPLLKLTIIPRSKGALGFAQYLPNEIPLETQQEMEDKITSILAGRIAEEEFFREVTTGAYDDLQKAYRIANAIVTKLGMTQRIGHVAYGENDYGVKNYSEAKGREIDLECRAIIDRCAARCRLMVREHRDKIERLSEILLDKETIDLRVIREVLGERPFPAKSNFREYLQEMPVEPKPAQP
jgi:AFG3 family protein